MLAAKRSSTTFDRSKCPISVTLDTLGDKWSLLLVRDMFSGKRRFSEFLASPEGIKRNILTERLRRLENAGILRKALYQTHPDRHEYLLTEAGVHLLPIIQAIARWAIEYVPAVWKPSETFLNSTPEQFLASRDSTKPAPARRKKTGSAQSV